MEYIQDQFEPTEFLEMNGFYMIKIYNMISEHLEKNAIIKEQIHNKIDFSSYFDLKCYLSNLNEDFERCINLYISNSYNCNKRKIFTYITYNYNKILYQ